MARVGAEGDLVDRVRGALSTLSEVTERKMFGSVGFMVRGHLCVSARAERIMCRIDPTEHNAAIARKGCETVVMKGQARLGYVYVQATELKTAKALSSWLNQAIAYNSTLASKVA